MPIYEFYSPEANRIYSFFARSVIGAEVVPRCPDNPEYSMRKAVSAFAVVGRAKEPGEAGEADLDDPRLEAAMAEMEREMAGLDEDNPDPRRMGQLMRRLSELTGEKMPESMQEMVARLEAGEDPDKLEEEYGDLEDLDDFGGEEAGEPAVSPLRRLRNRLREPSRDPQLYELKDYL